MENNGRPAFTDEQYQSWLEDMRPYLENANSIWYAMSRAGLLQHKDAIYGKYRLKDWFSEKIDRLRESPGELANDTIVSMLRAINTKVKRNESITSDENKLLMFYAEKSRSAMRWYVNRNETAPGKSIDEIVAELDHAEDDSINDVAENLKGDPDVNGQTQVEMVATEPPLQNQEQTGADSNVPPQPNTETV